MFGIQFYPTPPALVRRMMDKVDFSRVRYALEPSAGKGDLAAGIRERLQSGGLIDCVEIDPDLRAVLKERGYTTVGTDFLKFDGKTRYDLIAMNPPFRDGDKHLLHALDLMQNGGQIVCLLNASTMERTDSPIRRDLLARLQAYDAEIEYIPDAFHDAERKADVDCALIYVDIPRKTDEDILDHLKKALDMPHEELNECGALAENDIFKALLTQYELESRLGLSLIDQYKQCKKYLPTTCFGEMILSLSVKSSGVDVGAGLSHENAYLRELRKRYWDALFSAKEMQHLMTMRVRQNYLDRLEEFRAFDFTAENIAQVKLDMLSTLNGNVEDAILKMFDELTYEHSMGKNTNIHYYNGWKTNRACRVNKKVIIPFYGLYDPRWGGSWSAYKAKDFLEELEKILTYLDSGRTDGADCDSVISNAFRTSAKKYDGERLHCKFFDLEFKKKGTVHILFTDLDLLKKFNIFGGRHKNWLPESYGKTDYSAMSEEERAVVDSFEGKQAYCRTLSGASFFIGRPALTEIA